MKTTIALSFATALLSLGAGTGCSILSSEDIPYSVTPQEIAQDLSKAFSGESGSFPMVDCTASATLCSAIPGQLPASATITCDTSTTTPSKSECALHYDLTVHQTIDLSQEASSPSA